ncbi:unnamed protein product [Sphagnum jensenii]|uniref:Uncharacterized protein n=1 Tax=Sphagnum jensenii TaxID=128206 RepID=A0ABP1A912_9BRYO
MLSFEENMAQRKGTVTSCMAGDSTKALKQPYTEKQRQVYYGVNQIKNQGSPIFPLPPLDSSQAASADAAPSSGQASSESVSWQQYQSSSDTSSTAASEELNQVVSIFGDPMEQHAAYMVEAWLLK